MKAFRDAYCDRQLTPNFELNVFVCHISIRGFRNPVCLYPKIRNQPSLVNVSPTVVNDT